MKVDFLIAGVQKGGTSTLDAYLRGHPEICMAGRKEVHFFDNDSAFDAAPDYDQYHSNFSADSHGSNVRYGESTPIYMYWRQAPRRIYQYNPGIKWIVLLRNPIERAYSHWNMQRDRKMDPASFLDALRLEATRCQAAWPSQNRKFSYLDRGRYATQIRRIYDHFPKNQVLMLRSDDLYENPGSLLDRTYAFLGVSKQEIKGTLHLHARPYISPIGLQEWIYLKDLLEREIMSLEELTGWDCSNWLRPPASAIE